ncbi:unnamed protein product [Euphydryas editha]|uniref:MGA conserved domain-containing protein n=1 Tax=Euphydryas editha TaxID=104508 RepID=A0AAU9TZ47_EUPED|nr:unnamed protein product [Euphydryas editha]
MEVERKVFTSNIIRTQNKIKNNLLDILNKAPASPAPCKPDKTPECNFVPKCDKFYIPKKKNGMKVKTVRDIRSVFEFDVYSYLPTDLEKQKNLLLRKIRLGSSRDEKTKETAVNMLKSHSPISKSAWQMLMNINPEGHKFPRQYVLWNGQYIQVNGSKGGNCKFLFKYDIGKIKETPLKISTVRKNNFKRKKGLLQHSLNVKFKPGPLTKKKNLDTSYQKYQFGDMELVTLPKPGLDVQPSYGKPLSPAINTFLQNAFVLNSNGVISHKWADFAVSVLGTNKDGIPTQLNENCNITFDVDYKCYQRRILMRKDSEIINLEKVNKISSYMKEEETVILSEVTNVLNKIIDSVEISLKQDEMFIGEDEAREVTAVNSNLNSNYIVKDKGKRKYCELDRLDVTVIRISEAPESNTKDTCHNAYCKLGCVCDSLKYSYGLKTHCGRVECMFQCKCDFSKYKLSDSLDNNCSEIIPGLVNLDKKLGQTLSKEEQKFHQTVIVTDERSILVKSRKRNWKATKKYADFYSNMHLKADSVPKQTLKVVCTNLNLKNIEPWCLVHNLYKCFCKGKFTQSCFRSSGVDELPYTSNKTSEKNIKSFDNIDFTLEDSAGKANIDSSQNELNLHNSYSTRKRSIRSSIESSVDSVVCKNDKCARTLPYKSRKYDDDYYKSTNIKILEMEQNDKTLRKKLLSIIHKNDTPDNNLLYNINIPEVTNSPPNLNDLINNAIEEIPVDYKNVKKLSSKKLVKWLECNYKQYKEKSDQSPKKHSLQPPRPGSIALYPWDFILSRYRERKNHFLISKQQPFRIFMAVDIKNSLFENCININDIALSDLDKYPITVKNLLTNATDLKDNFCILCGLLQCWELVGSVSKVNSARRNSTQENELDKFIEQRVGSQSDCGSDVEFSPVLSSNSDDLSNSDNILTIDKKQVSEINTEQSKWFVMTVENDFAEIRFYKKGFFVKYDSIMKAINVAKLSGKTVKLSPQNCSSLQNNPNFGIYAIPSDIDNYVFIGPYEKDEPLGVETVKTIHDIKKANRTRGIWITTNKIDNLKVIDNPLMYMPLRNTKSHQILSLENDTCNKNESSLNLDVSRQLTNKGVIGKIVKPIKIPKSNSFYMKYPHTLLVKKNSLLINKKTTSDPNTPGKLNSTLVYCQDINKQEVQTEKKVVFQCQKPIAEIAPQIKDPSSDSLSSDIRKRKLEGGMFILKPEEINKRSFEKQLQCQQQQQLTYESPENNSTINMDIENFLKSSVICAPPKHECYVISDDEDDNVSNQTTKDDTLKDVWIVCKNIDSLGWIPGRRNSLSYLSFEFPGFKYSEFYNETEAFNKITQVLSRKIYIPRHINLEWHALDTLPEGKARKKLEAEELSTDYVLTKKGLQNKLDLLKKLKSIKNLDRTIEDCKADLTDKSKNRQAVKSGVINTQTFNERFETITPVFYTLRSSLYKISTSRNNYIVRRNNL